MFFLLVSIQKEKIYFDFNVCSSEVETVKVQKSICLHNNKSFILCLINIMEQCGSEKESR